MTAEQGNIPLPDFVEEPFQIRDGVLWRCLNVVPHGLRWEPVGNVAELIQRCSRAEADNLKLKKWVADLLEERSALQRAAEFLEDAAKSDCTGALVVLSRNHFCTPEETYGRNTSWAISDLCRALDALRLRCERLEKPVTQEEKSRVGGMWLREEVNALLAARKGE